jgi:hypothetical protein
MKHLKPYQNISEAMIHLDNGGHFFNLFTKADDGEINTAELIKVAGLFNQQQRLVLFLELSISSLSKQEQVEIISRLDDKLRSAFLKYKAQELMACEANKVGIVGGNTIITGIPKIKESKTEFQGVVLIPILTGKVMTFVPIAIMDRYDLYEVCDDEQSEVFIIAHYRRKIKLPAEKIKVAGLLKEIQVKEDGVTRNQKFLEINYYSNFNEVR